MAAEDPDELPVKLMLDDIMKEIATAEAQRDEALEKLAAEPDHNENIRAAIRAGWIIPNYFEQEDFDKMEGWDKDRLEQFQSYLDSSSRFGKECDFVYKGLKRRSRTSWLSE